MIKKNQLEFIYQEPYRLFFPLGVLMLLWGSVLWIPQIWSDESYPVLAHRYLMINGFSTFFIAGFLMTAVPKFAQTKSAQSFEVCGLMIVIFSGLFFSFKNWESSAYITSGLSSLIILLFLFRRIMMKKVNPPYSFVFIFIGLFFWIFSSFMSAYIPLDVYKNLHSEAAIMAIILGVGSRLVPGILGHVDVVQSQRAQYEVNRSFLQTIPLFFIFLILSFVLSYFLKDSVGNWLRVLVVSFVGLFYWKLYKWPKEKSALTINIWFACWLIIGSFLLKALWPEGGIHAGHSFFFGGIVLLSFLIATRVLQSHGPGDKKLENRKNLYVISSLIVLAGATRVTAILMPEAYLRHLGYSSFTLILATLIWGFYYLRFVGVFRKS